jgi:hypothetical protein
MDERWDNDLIKRIKEVFDNYEDTSADDGWLLLREKYPEKAKRRIAGWIWLSGAAALLLLFVGILWLKTGKNDNGQQLANKTKPVKHDTISQIASNNPANQHRDSSAMQKQNQTPGEAEASKNTIAKNSATVGKTSGERNISKPAFTVNQSNNIAKNTVQPSKVKLPAKENENGILPQSNPIAKVQPGQQSANMPGKSEPTVTGNNNIIANAKPKNSQQVTNAQTNAKVDTGTKSYAVNNQPGVNMRQQQTKKQGSIFESENNVASNQKEPEKKLPKDKVVKFGIYAATYFNYAKGSSNQFNVGAGVTSDIRITDNLKLSTGVSIGQNSLSYSQIPLQQSTAAPALLAASSGNYAMAQSLYTVSTPRFNSYDADLVGLDVPLNLKYIFNPGKNETYILAGVSSGAFLNEKYTYSYNNPSLFNANVAQAQDQSNTSSLGSFYFARTLNVAFGTGYMVGGNRLTIEPFLKYPLEGLGVEQLKFGAGGVNLKFDFRVKKK